MASSMSALALRLQREGVRAGTGTGRLTALAVLSQTIGAWMAFTVAGGTWMFLERAQHPEQLAADTFGALPVADGLNVYVLLAPTACAFIVPALASMTAQSAVLGASGRERRLAALRLLGLTSGDVTRMTMAETGLQGVLGVVLGTLLSILTAPLWHLVRFQGRPIGTWEMLLPWWLYPAIGLVLVLLALGASAWGLQRVRVSPLGVARREIPRALRWWRLAVFALVAVVGIPLLVLLRPSTPNLASALMLLGVLALMVFSINLVASWLLQVGARIGSHLPGAATLVAGRRVGTDARATWRRVSSMAYLGVIIGAMAVAPIGAMGGDAGSILDHDIPIGAMLTLGFGFIIAAVSIVLGQSSQVFEQAELGRSLTRMGVPRPFHTRVSLWQSLAPLAFSTLGGIGWGVLLGMAMSSSSGGISAARLPMVAVLVLIGFGLALAATLAVEPLRSRTLAAVVRRND